jgi:general secretion pathway protein C
MQSWLSRAKDNAPHLVSLVLAALIVLEGTRVTSTVLQAGAASRHIQSAASNRTAVGGVKLIDVQSIVQRHLFGLAADDAVPDPGPLSGATQNLGLLGTIATENPERGLAIVTVDGPAKVYSVGERLAGASLHAVYMDRILLDRGGRMETVYLPHPLLADGGRFNRRPVAADATPEPPQSLGDIIGLDPSVSLESGALLGFRLRRGAAKAASIPSGLQSGDIVTTVNGESLTDKDQEQSEKIVDNMLASNHATVSVLRNGVAVDVSVELGQ